MDDRSGRGPGRRIRGWLPAVWLALPLLAGCVYIGRPGPDAHFIDSGHRPLRQKGTANLVDCEAGVTRVYYPVPYASPPNLSFDTFHAAGVELVDQQPDHFAIRAKPGTVNPAPFGLEWTAVGMPASAAPCLPPPLIGPELPFPPPPDPVPGAVGP